MNTAAETRLARNRVENLNQLANQAEAEGVRIVLLHRMPQHLAIDPGMPVAYAVSESSCSCRQFLIWDRCPHHALLLSELGMLPSPDEIGWPDEVRVEMIDCVIAVQPGAALIIESAAAMCAD